MSHTENPPPPPPDGEQPGGERKPGGPRRPERPASNLFWYLLLGLVMAAVVFSLTRGRQKGDELKFSDFYQGLDPRGELAARGEKPRFRKDNVFELTIGPEFITFQDQPKDSQAETTYYYIPVVGMKEGSEAKLTALLDEKNIKYSYDEPPPQWQSVATLLFIPLLIVVFFLFLLRRMGGAGSAMSFGRSRGKLYAQEDVQITFKEVAGIEEAVDELREVVEFLKNPDKYHALGGRIPRGVLLVGPPGTGKTLLAKAVAGEAGVPFFGLSGSDFVEMFVGVGAARVRDMFQQAAQRSPSIIFIDELDALGKTRGSGMPGGHDEREQTLNALLVEMDGFGSDLSVIVIGATNRPETLDAALLRPGRFDRHVVVDRPDIQGRQEILKVHAARVKMDDSVDLRRLAKMTPGFVGADLANLVNEAALLAARNNKTKVTMVEFEEGVERVVAGLEKQTRVIHEDEKLRIAYHECGHALVACSLPHTDPVHKISIIPRGMGLGYTLHFPEDERQLATRTELSNKICTLLGGIVAEDVVFQETSSGAQNDLQRATDIARRMVTDFGMSPRLGRVHYSEGQRSSYLGLQFGASEVVHSEQTIREIDLEVKRILDEAVATVEEILTSRREALDHMSRELLEKETMDAEHLKKILDQHAPYPAISPGTRTAERPEARPAQLDAAPPARKASERQ